MGSGQTHMAAYILADMKSHESRAIEGHKIGAFLVQAPGLCPRQFFITMAAQYVLAGPYGVIRRNGLGQE